MRKIFYNYYLPLRNFFINNADIKKYLKWYDFRPLWNTKDKILIILPIMSFDLIGLDIRYAFREHGLKGGHIIFLLIGTIKQINFALSQNDYFLRNSIYEITLPHDYDTLESAILKKIQLIEEEMGE